VVKNRPHQQHVFPICRPLGCPLELTMLIVGLRLLARSCSDILGITHDRVGAYAGITLEFLEWQH
jgi:hypothetical protein